MKCLFRDGTAALLLCWCSAVRAQVSPGPLSAPHQFLEGPLKCANCHTFGAGSPKLRCLHCHAAIRERVAGKAGYHGRVVERSKGDTDCARCHTEHYGENFNIIRWRTSKDEFDHRETGYPLLGRHAALRCEQCHTARHIAESEKKIIAVKNLNRTFLGVSPACLTCHEDRHRGQLGADCQRCHDFSRWQPPRPFDHNTAKFPLTGRHRDVQCGRCHKPLASDPKVIQYTGLKFAECSGCHQDPHRGAFQARCDSCHNADSWRQVRLASSSFDHDRTRFPLDGKHAGLACMKCHRDSNFKTPVAHAKCLDCHEDRHQGQFQRRADNGDCGSCHTVKGWRPSTYSAADHRSTGFPLTGKHQGVECARCHTPAAAATNYHPKFQACMDCHRDPHGGQFARLPLANRCEECHTVDTFRPSTFTLARHQATRFPLGGAHAAVACLDCHRDRAQNGRQFHFANVRCQACHDDPHRDTAAGLCENCHGLRSWRELKPFDHAATGFALAGAHRALRCAECHRPLMEQTRRLPFQGAPKDCAGCHEDVHAGQFQRDGRPADCSECHTPARWAASMFDHDRGTSFSLSGAHERVPCRLCHTQSKQIGGRAVVMYNATPRECAACHRQ